MLKKPAVLIALATLLLVSAVHARDSERHFPVADVLENPEYADRLAGVTFYFGDQEYPVVERQMGEYQANKKTNAFSKSDKAACDWAFLSGLLSLRARAIAEGGNAVIGVHGYYKKRTFRSDTEYQCGAGNVMAGVTLKGTVAKLAE